MPRAHPLTLVSLVALALTLALAGCGSDSDKQSSDEASPAKLTQQDAEAKSNARELATAVEACFVDQQSYEACAKPSDTQLPLGAGSGQVEVSEATATGYTIIARSASTTSFELAKDAGELTRSCDEPATGGCREGGSW